MKYLFFITLFFNFVSYQAQEIIADRPDQTEASSIVPKNSLQIEMGFLKGNHSSKNESYFFGPSILLRYSINNFIEARVFNQFEHYNYDDQDKLNGFSDIEIGFKMQLFKKDRSQTEIAFLTHAIIPTAKKYISNDLVGISNKLCISHMISDEVNLGYNVGYNYLEQLHSFTYSIAVGISITDSLGCFLEPYGEYYEQGIYESNFDGGFTYLLKPNFQLDASYGFGLNNHMNFFSLGFSWNIAHVL